MEELIHKKRVEVLLEVGSVFFDTIQGLCIVTKRFKPRNEARGFHGYEVGRYERFFRKGHEFILYDSKFEKVRPATDKDYCDYLLRQMSRFDLGNGHGLTIHTDGVFLFDDDNFLGLSIVQTLKLRDLLNEELAGEK